MPYRANGFGFVCVLVLLNSWALCDGSESDSGNEDSAVDPVIHFTHETCQSKIASGDGFDSYYDADSFKNEHGVLELLVRLRGPSDGHILLTNARNESAGGYFIVIGSMANTQSEIRRSKWSAPVFKLNTPEILSDFQFRGFLIRYNKETGILRVYSEGSEMPLLHWKDEKPLDVHFFSFAAYYDILVQFAFNCMAKDHHSLILPHSNFSGGVSATSPDSGLREQILEKYDPVSQPPESDDGGITTVTLNSFKVLHYNIDDKEQTLEIHARLSLSWVDERLRWSQFSPSSNQNGFLHFKKSELWKPDLVLFNSAKPKTMDDFGDDAHVLVMADGSTLWSPPVKFTSHCKLDLYRWPYDTQECHLRIGSWNFGENDLDIQFGGGGTEIQVLSSNGHSYANNTEWNVVDASMIRTTKNYTCCPDNYVLIVCSFDLERKYTGYTFTLVFPIIMISIISVTSFLLPSTNTVRSLLGCTMLMMITTYLIYFRLRLPNTDQVPYIVRLFVWEMFVISFNLIMTITLTLLSINSQRKPPEWIRWLLNCGIGSLFLLKQTSDSEKKTNFPSESESNNIENPMSGNTTGIKFQRFDVETNSSKNLNDWNLATRLIDRFAFVIFTFLTILMFFCHLG